MVRVVVNASWPTRHDTPHHLLQALFADTVARDPRGEHVSVELSRRPGFAFDVVHAKYAVIDGETLLLRTNNFLTLDGVARDFYNVSAELVGPVAGTVRDDWINLQATCRVVRAASHLRDAWPVVAPSRATAADGHAGAKDAGTGSTMAVLAKNSRVNFWSAGDTNPQNAGLLALIDASEHEIHSLNPALNVRNIKRALENAILHRGVEVTLVLSLNMNRAVQHRLQGGDNSDTLLEMYRNLLTRGGEEAARRLHVRWASAGTGAPAPANALGNNHAKTALYDGEVTWLGSMNWDCQSWNNSRELNVVVFDRSLAPRWTREIWLPAWQTSAPLRAEDLPGCVPGRDDRKAAAVCAFLRGAVGETSAR